MTACFIICDSDGQNPGLPGTLAAVSGQNLPCRRKGTFIRMTDRKIEILSPAGSYRAFVAAIHAGADAVYVGGSRFGARAFADNFTEDELIQAIREAHFYNRRLYLTVNTLLKDAEIDTLGQYLTPFYKSGLDAVIVQDMGVVEYIRGHFPGLDIHASTQMTITGAQGAKFIRSQGISRVVPARELSLGEIREIRKQTDLEIECFVHGALCYCYSGQCLLSSMIGGRSGNRGQCAQPCRLPYTVDGEKHFYLSPKDICTLDLIPDMADAGIDSFKIEGRMKKPEYVAAVTSMYRKYTDLYFNGGRENFRILPEDREILMDLYNRGGFSEGYYKQHNGRSMIALNRPNHTGVPAVRVENQKGREVRAKTLTDLNAGDVLEITGGKDNYTLGKAVGKGNSISFLVRRQTRLSRGTVLNRIRNESLIRHIDQKIINRKLQLPVSGHLSLKTGAPGTLRVSAGGITGEACTEEAVQQAQNRPMEKERILRQIQKTGSSDFYFEKLNIEMDDDIFIPIQQLNSLRRTAFEQMREKLMRKSERETIPAVISRETVDCAGKNHENIVPSGWQPVFSVSIRRKEQLLALRNYITGKSHAIRRIYIDSGLLMDHDEAGRNEIPRLLRLFSRENIELMPALPHILRHTGGREMEERARIIKDSMFSGVLIRNCEAYGLLRSGEFDKKIILDHNLYVFNRFARTFWQKNGVSGFTAPLELNRQELKQLGLYDCELVVYGYTPVMVSAQCILKTSDKCRRNSPGIHRIKDRYDSQYFVENHCDFCYNIIYTDRPIYLGDELRQLTELMPEYLRLEFTVEDQRETEKLLDLFHAVFCRGEEEHTLDIPYTQGHFKRGVL